MAKTENAFLKVAASFLLLADLALGRRSHCTRAAIFLSSLATISVDTSSATILVYIA